MWHLLGALRRSVSDRSPRSTSTGTGNNRKRYQLMEDVSHEVYESAVRGRQHFRSLLIGARNEIDRLKAAMLADIRGAGPFTGPIYHENIRKALNLPLEGDGAEILKETLPESGEKP